MTYKTGERACTAPASLPSFSCPSRRTLTLGAAEGSSMSTRLCLSGRCCYVCVEDREVELGERKRKQRGVMKKRVTWKTENKEINCSHKAHSALFMFHIEPEILYYGSGSTDWSVNACFVSASALVWPKECKTRALKHNFRTRIESRERPERKNLEACHPSAGEGNQHLRAGLHLKST